MKKHSRANGAENKIIRPFLESRCKAAYGKLLCEICLGEKCGCKDDRSSENKLLIEHANGNSNDWSPGNLRLASQSCNMREFHRLKKEGKVSVDFSRERGRGKTDLLLEIIKIKNLSYDSVANWKSHVVRQLIDEYVLNEMLKNPEEGCSVEQLANDCANLFPISVSKSREYIHRKTFNTGEYRYADNSSRERLLWKLKFLEEQYKKEIDKYTK